MSRLAQSVIPKKGKLTVGFRQPKSIIDSPWGWELQKLEENIKKNETTSIQDRWQYGKVLVLRRGNDKQLPKGVRDLLAARDGIGQREIGYRIQFAETYPTKRELGNALPSFSSWRDVIRALPKKAKATPAADPKVVGQGAVALRRVLKDIRTLHAVEWGEADVRAFDELKAELMRIQEEINSAGVAIQKAAAS